MATRNGWLRRISGNLHVTAQHVITGDNDIKGTEVAIACYILICHDFNVAARHIGVTAQYASVEKGHY